MPNTNFQTFHQMGNAINDVVRQATGRDAVQNIDMDFVTVAQNKRVVEEIITGNPASFVTNISEPIDYLIVQIDAVQSGSGDPSPSNIRPISGWTGANVSRTGKNLIYPKYESRTQNNVTFTVNSDGTITTTTDGTASGTAYAAQNLSNDPSKMQLIPAGTYTLTGGVNNSERVYLGGKYIDNSSLPSGYDSGSGITYTLTKPAYVYPQIVISSGTASNRTFNIQLELSSTASDYTPYVGNTYPIAFPSEVGTVYGGTLTVNKDGSGELVVGYKYYENAGTGNWGSTEIGGSRYYIGGITTDAINADTSGCCNIGELITDYYGNGVQVSNNGRISLCGSLYSAFADENALKAYLAEHPLQLVYKLATPVTYQLTNQQVIETLKGVNNVWADTGDVTVLYKNYEEVI